MKCISWNVNGIRACVKKGFMDFYKSIDADIFCIQETKMEKGQSETDFTLEGRYLEYWNSAEKKGYSGTAVFTKREPVNVTYGLGIEKHDKEGRVISLEFEDYFLINAYVPNSKSELERLDYRMEWEDDMRKYLKELDNKKPVIFCGDFNVAHKEIDLKNPKSNKRNAGFTDEERNKMTDLLNSGFSDIYRIQNPDKTDIYTWWSYIGKAREKNVGWRIDYFIVSESIKNKVKETYIYPEIMGSDHCPIGMDINF